MHPLLLLLLVTAFLSCGKPAVSYFGQEPPGTVPELFAPSMVNTDSVELNAVFNGAMTELFFTRIVRGRFVIYHSEYLDGRWTSAQPIQLFADTTVLSTAADMSLTPDGLTMYFLGIYPQDSMTKATADIYASQKVNGRWQPATKVGHPISTDLYAEASSAKASTTGKYFIHPGP